MSLTDRAKSAIEAFVTRLTSKYDYSIVYSYTVEVQNSDGSLELRPVRHEKCPSLSKVEILYGTPAEKVKVKKGSQCYVMFADADPSKPFAFGFRHGDYEQLDLGDSAVPMARIGDIVQSGGPATICQFSALTAPGVMPSRSYSLSNGPLVMIE